MRLAKLLTIAAGSLSLAACTQQEAKPNEPFCQSDGEGGAEVIDPVTQEKIFTLGDIHESKTNYVWGDAIDSSGKNTGLGFNVYLADDTISSCLISDNSGEGKKYYPKPANPDGPK